MNTALIVRPMAAEIGRTGAPTPRSAALADTAAPRNDARSDTAFLRRIDRGGTHWISRPQGRRIVCDSGRLWLCFDGDLTDVMLLPGQSHRCELHSRLSVYALEAGSFHVV